MFFFPLQYFNNCDFNSWGSSTGIHDSFSLPLHVISHFFFWCPQQKRILNMIIAKFQNKNFSNDWVSDVKYASLFGKNEWRKFLMNRRDSLRLFVTMSSLAWAHIIRSVFLWDGRQRSDCNRLSLLSGWDVTKGFIKYLSI